MIDFVVRPARPQDAEGLAACIDEAYATYKGVIPDLPDVSGDIAKEIDDHHVWVAWLDDRIVGGLVLIESSDDLKLANIAVSPSQRGTGLGRHFIELAQTECRKLGYHRLLLSTHVQMPENVKLYEHFGWRVCGQSANQIHMMKTIPAPSS